MNEKNSYISGNHFGDNIGDTYLQSCFTPYPEMGDPQRDSRDRDRDSGLRDDMHRRY